MGRTKTTGESEQGGEAGHQWALKLQPFCSLHAAPPGQEAAPEGRGPISSHRLQEENSFSPTENVTSEQTPSVYSRAWAASPVGRQWQKEGVGRYDLNMYQQGNKCIRFAASSNSLIQVISNNGINAAFKNKEVLNRSVFLTGDMSTVRKASCR